MKNVIVTGATRGLGLAIVERLLRDDYFIIAVGRSPSAEFETLLKDNSDRIVFYKFDFNEIDKIPELANSIIKTHGIVYGLVNNAGMGSDGLLATQHATDISKVLRVNLEAPILLSKYICRSMMVKSEGRIINISSIIASTGFSGLSVYAATKAGLEGFTRSLSRELGRIGITVNCVAPGYMETAMTEGLKGDKLNSIKRRAPLGLPRPDDVSGAIAFLLSSESNRTTGTVITVDGGSTA